MYTIMTYIDGKPMYLAKSGKTEKWVSFDMLSPDNTFTLPKSARVALTRWRSASGDFRNTINKYKVVQI